MSIKVRVPPPLRSATQGRSTVDGEGSTFKDVVEDLDRKYPGFSEKLCTAEGSLRKFFNVYVNGERVETRRVEAIRVTSGDNVALILTIAGG